MSSLTHSGVQFIMLTAGSIMTLVTSSHQFTCVTTLSESPQWYYNDTLLPTNSTSKTSSFTNLSETGNYTCAINADNHYTVTLTTGLLYKSL